MRGKPKSTRMELMPQQSSLIIKTLRLPDETWPALKQEHTRQITQENKQAQHIGSQIVDSALHFLHLIRFFR